MYWKPYLDRIRELSAGEYIDFPELADKLSINRIRITLTVQRKNLNGWVKTEVLKDGSLRVLKFSAQDAEVEDRRKSFVLPAESTPEPEPITLVVATSCSHKACPYPPRASGMCRQHENDERAEVSTIGSGLSPKGLAGA